MADAKEKASGKLTLWNYSRNPHELRKGPEGERRTLPVGGSIECLDQAEFDQLKKYTGMRTSQMVAPAMSATIAELRKANEKYKKKD